MEQRQYRPIEFEARPGEWFNIVHINLPVPRRFFSRRTSAHLTAGLRELKLAAQSLIDEQFERIERLRPRLAERDETAGETPTEQPSAR